MWEIQFGGCNDMGQSCSFELCTHAGVYPDRLGPWGPEGIMQLIIKRQGSALLRTEIHGVLSFATQREGWATTALPGAALPRPHQNKGPKAARPFPATEAMALPWTPFTIGGGAPSCRLSSGRVGPAWGARPVSSRVAPVLRRLRLVPRLAEHLVIIALDDTHRAACGTLRCRRCWRRGQHIHFQFDNCQPRGGGGGQEPG